MVRLTVRAYVRENIRMERRSWHAPPSPSRTSAQMISRIIIVLLLQLFDTMQCILVISGLALFRSVMTIRLRGHGGFPHVYHRGSRSRGNQGTTREKQA